MPWIGLPGVKTNQDLLDLLGEELIGAAVWQRLLRLDQSEVGDWFATGNLSANAVSTSFGDDPLDPEVIPAAWRLVSEGLTGPIRLFVKNEPHTAAKALQQRWRLISSVEVIDQLVERLLHWEQNEIEIHHWHTLPVKPGMGLDDRSLELLLASLQENFTTPKCTDASGWDWCVQYASYRHFVQHRIDLAARAHVARGDSLEGVIRHGFFARCMRARAACLMLSVFMLSDGHVFCQTEPGIQKSGSFCTASSNSYMRWYLAKLVGADYAMCMGDDAVEEPSARWDINHYMKWGYRIELSEHDCIDFCSQHLGTTVSDCYPLNVQKLVVRALFKKPVSQVQEAELLASLQNDLRHHPERQHWCNIVAAGWRQATNN